MTRVRDNAGFTLVELLLAATLMLIVTGATLSWMDHAWGNFRRNQDETFAVGGARNALDLIARDTRNATAYQTSANLTAAAILRATPTDLVFKTVNPFAAASAGNGYGVRTVRYCLSNSRLYRQITAGAAMPSTSCPDSTWTAAGVSSNIVNGARSVFSYDQSTLSAITRIAVDLDVNPDPARRLPEIALHSALFLRNINRAPVASFTALPGPNRHVRLNASASYDADGGALNFAWSDGSTQLIQTGAVFDYVAPTTGSRTFTLTVTDGGGLTDTTTRTVTVTS